MPFSFQALVLPQFQQRCLPWPWAKQWLGSAAEQVRKLFVLHQRPLVLLQLLCLAAPRSVLPQAQYPEHLVFQPMKAKVTVVHALLSRHAHALHSMPRQASLRLGPEWMVQASFVPH